MAVQGKEVFFLSGVPEGAPISLATNIPAGGSLRVRLRGPDDPDRAWVR